jgi:urea transporter
MLLCVAAWVVLGYLVSLLVVFRTAIESENKEFEITFPVFVYVICAWPIILAAYLVEFAVIVAVSILDILPWIIAFLDKVFLAPHRKLHSRILKIKQYLKDND